MQGPEVGGDCFVYSRGRYVQRPEGVCYYNNDGRYLDSISPLFRSMTVGGFLIREDDPEYHSASQYTYRLTAPGISTEFWRKDRGVTGFLRRMSRLSCSLRKVNTLISMGPTLGSLLAVLLAPKSTRKILYSGIAYTPAGPFKHLLEYVETLALRRSHGIICTGKHLQADYLARGASRVECAVPLLNLPDRTGKLPMAAPRKGIQRLIAVGVLGSRKRQEDLLEAACILLERHGTCPEIHLVGKGDLDGFRQRAAAMIRILGSRLHLHGHVADPARMSQLYISADALVICSVSEGFPRVVYEAMMHGLPVISTPLPGLTASFTDGEDLLFFPFRNPQALADRIQALTENHDLVERLVSNNRVYLEKALARSPVAQLRSILESM